ncbi:hypothetical protein [Tenacibaculum xiamenense]|uniref:hypothetical protein n=1 Tax=Tenacibaculum xiamenense TaxID=1261553 RepID=UPI0038949083
MNNDLKNSIDFLDKKTKKENGFAVPENYLNDFDAKVLNQKSVNLSNQTPFKAPDSYFDSLEETLFEKIKGEDTSKQKVIPLYKRLVQLVPTAAAAAVLIFAGYMYTKTTGAIDFNSISSSEIENLYENGYIDTSGDELIVALDETDINFEIETFDSIVLDYENMEDYLDNLEENTIINEIQ